MEFYTARTFLCKRSSAAMHRMIVPYAVRAGRHGVNLIASHGRGIVASSSWHHHHRALASSSSHHHRALVVYASSGTGFEAEDANAALKDALDDLETKDHVKMAKALLRIWSVATSPHAKVPALEVVLPRLVSLIVDRSLSVAVQAYACGALTALMLVNHSLYLEAAQTPMLAKGLVQCAKEGVHDEGPLLLQATAAITVLAQGVEGLLPLQIADGESTVISCLGSVRDAYIKDEVVSAICAFAVHVENRENLLQKGAVLELARVIQDMDTSMDVSLRGLQGLSLLCGSSFEAQVQLASMEGVLDALNAHMESSDSSIKEISQGLVGVLVQNHEVKTMLENRLSK